MNEKEKRRLMKVKKRINKKRPKFVQYESWRFVRIKDHWRQPKGIDNKMRLNLSGWPKSVNVGWGSPKAIRHLHPSGKEEIMVWAPKDLNKIDPELQVARIGGSVGAKKREVIKEKADELNIRILNMGQEKPDEFEELEDDEE